MSVDASDTTSATIRPSWSAYHAAKWILTAKHSTIDIGALIRYENIKITAPKGYSEYDGQRASNKLDSGRRIPGPITTPGQLPHISFFDHFLPSWLLHGLRLIYSSLLKI